MRRTAYLVAALFALAALAAGCSGGGCSKKGGGWDTKPATEFKGWLDSTLGNAPWYAEVEEVEQTTRLGLPVVYIRTKMSNASRDVAADDIQARAGTATALPFDGTVYIFGAQDMPREFVIGSPPAPAKPPAAPSKAEDVAGWLDTAYGATGEPWLKRITGSRLDQQRGAVVVTTDLDFNDADDRWLGQTVLDALRSSKLEFADYLVVLYADGTNETSGGK